MTRLSSIVISLFRLSFLLLLLSHLSSLEFKFSLSSLLIHALVMDLSTTQQALLLFSTAQSWHNGCSIYWKLSPTSVLSS
ncbi:hypothetical protein BDP27DRAFT_1334945 [Rhodocollybia butyracea]|uniref:Secreted protein n=1 Tax=Rhodocollybia butyracea TaxID=206335 RepID=A0A9P5PGQ9_9AGAR|nr:hypothetical protein BDP27DRAFT_1350465 [Rhodocollybia butyracea]KAF9063578.1 hypothetical protein BDP27DRAFT_1334945 [Rhodocollybia butyracea]